MQKSASTKTKDTATSRAIAVCDSFGNLTSHLQDDALSGDMPKGFLPDWMKNATWGADKKRAAGAASLGLAGVAASEKQVDAGIIISGGDDATYVARGVTYSVAGGGSVGALKVQSDTQTVYSSLVFVDPWTAVSSAHQYSSSFGNNQQYTVYTGSNYESSPFYIPSEIKIHPSYGGSAGQGIDLAVLKFPTAVPGVSLIDFATTVPALNETVWTAGYGVHGSPALGYIPQDGNIRAGSSIARNTPPLLGADPLFYRNTLFDDVPFNPTGLRPASGDSGGGVFNAAGAWLGPTIGGSNSASVGGHVFLNAATVPTARDFVFSNMGSAVPEPTSLALVLSVAVGWLFNRRHRRS